MPGEFSIICGGGDVWNDGDVDEGGESVSESQPSSSSSSSSPPLLPLIVADANWLTISYLFLVVSFCVL